MIEFVEDNDERPGESRVTLAADAIWSRRSMKRIDRVLAAGGVDVAHFHNTFFRISPAAYYVCRRRGVPVVQTLHNYRLLCPSATLYRNGGVCESCLGKSAAWPGIRHACYRDSRLETSVVASAAASPVRSRQPLEAGSGPTASGSPGIAASASRSSPARAQTSTACTPSATGRRRW